MVIVLQVHEFKEDVDLFGVCRMFMNIQQAVVCIYVYSRPHNFTPQHEKRNESSLRRANAPGTSLENGVGWNASQSLQSDVRLQQGFILFDFLQKRSSLRFQLTCRRASQTGSYNLNSNICNTDAEMDQESTLRPTLILETTRRFHGYSQCPRPRVLIRPVTEVDRHPVCRNATSTLGDLLHCRDVRQARAEGPSGDITHPHYTKSGLKRRCRGCIKGGHEMSCYNIKTLQPLQLQLQGS